MSVKRIENNSSKTRPEPMTPFVLYGNQESDGWGCVMSVAIIGLIVFFSVVALVLFKIYYRG